MPSASGAAAGATGAAVSTAGSDLIPQGGSLYNLGNTNLTSFSDYLNQLASGNPALVSQAAGPQIQNITQQATNAKNQIATLPRGGEQNYLQAENDISESGGISQLLDQIISGAHTAQGALGQFGTQSGLSAEEAAAQLELGAGNNYLNQAGVNAQRDAGIASTFADILTHLGTPLASSSGGGIIPFLGGANPGLSPAVVAADQTLPAGSTIGYSATGAPVITFANGSQLPLSAYTGAASIPGAAAGTAATAESIVPGLGPASAAGDLAGVSVPGFTDTSGLAGGTVEGQFTGDAVSGSGSSGLSSILDTTAGNVAGGVALGAGIPLAVLALMGDSPFSSAADQGTVNDIAGNAQTTENADLSQPNALPQEVSQIVSQAKQWEAANPGKNFWQDNPGVAEQLQQALNFSRSMTNNASTYATSIFGPQGPAGGENPTPTNYTGAQASGQINTAANADTAAVQTALQELGAEPWMISAILNDQGSFGPGGAYAPVGG